MAGKPQSTADQELAASVARDFDQMRTTRGVWEMHWEEIAQRMMPASRGSFNANNLRTPGQKRNMEIYDSTAVLALGRFAAILDSLLTPRNQTWHNLRSTDPQLNKNRDVQLYFDTVNRLLFDYRYAPRANFSSQNQKDFRSLGAFGTSAMFIDPLDQKADGEMGIRYRSVTLGQLYIAENHQGIVDKAGRKFKLTARQAIEKFGEDNLDPAVIEAMKTQPEREYDFVHMVKPRADIDPFRKDYKGMKFCSYHVMLEGMRLVREGGYNTFPYAISRYEQEDDEVYGRSPAMDALPAVKTLNEEKKAVLTQGHRIINPIYLAADDGIVDVFSAKPGTMVPGGVTSDGRPLVHTLPTGNVQAGKELMDDERKVINDLFLVNLFQILTESPQMTATEIMERTREKGILLAPTVGRQQSEKLGPTIERELDVLSMQGLLPPIPIILKQSGAKYKVGYDSPLTRAQRAEEAAGIMRTVEQALSIFNATQDHSVLDGFDLDEIMPALAEINGVPAKWMRSVEDIAKIRASRSQQQQQQQMIQAAPAAAAVMKAQAISSKTQASG